MEFQELEGHFPFDKMRPSQQAALEKFVETTNRDRKFTILELPTGVGKSGIAVTLGRWASQVGNGAYLLTIQKMLQEQYLKEFPELVELKGASNYRCRDYPTTCEDGHKIAKMDNKPCTSCPYKEAKEQFIDTPFGVTNFAYFCSGIANQKTLFKERKLLIIDEAHNTEQTLINHSNIEITPHRAAELGVRLPSPPLKPNDISRAKQWISKEVYPAINLLRIKNESDKKDARHKGDDRALYGIVKQDAALDMLETKLLLFTESGSDMWFIGHEEKLEIKPLSGELFAEEMLFSMADQVVLLSATILDPRTFVRNLGLSPKQCGYLEVPSEFPLENRRIVFSPAGSMSFKNYEATLPKMLKKIEKVLNKHDGEKGIIHCQSYKTMNHILSHFKGTPHARRLLGHDPGMRSKKMALDIHAERQDGTVLLSPSMTEGLDLRDDLSRFQIVAKMPFASLADPYVKTRMQLDKDWYRLQTALTLVQSLGRSIRSAEDHATSYILDGDFGFFLKDAEQILPKWWVDAIDFK